MHRIAGLALFLAVSASALAAEQVLSLRVNGTLMTISPDDIASATRVDEAETGLAFRLTAARARDLATLTGNNIGEVMQLSICGQELIAPVIREAIVSGSFMVTPVPRTAAQTYLAVLSGKAPCESLGN